MPPSPDTIAAVLHHADASLRRLARPAVRTAAHSLASAPSRTTGRTASAPPNGCATSWSTSASPPRCGRPPAIPSWSAHHPGAGRLPGPARPVLRPLRRAAGRSAGALAQPAVRAAAGRRPARQALRRARRGGRQGPGDDVPRGPARLARRRPAASRPHHRADRGRGGGRQPNLEPFLAANKRRARRRIWR